MVEAVVLLRSAAKVLVLLLLRLLVFLVDLPLPEAVLVVLVEFPVMAELVGLLVLVVPLV